MAEVSWCLWLRRWGLWWIWAWEGECQINRTGLSGKGEDDFCLWMDCDCLDRVAFVVLVLGLLGLDFDYFGVGCLGAGGFGCIWLLLTLHELCATDWLLGKKCTLLYSTRLFLLSALHEICDFRQVMELSDGCGCTAGSAILFRFQCPYIDGVSVRFSSISMPDRYWWFPGKIQNKFSRNLAISILISESSNLERCSIEGNRILELTVTVSCWWLFVHFESIMFNQFTRLFNTRVLRARYK